MRIILTFMFLLLSLYAYVGEITAARGEVYSKIANNIKKVSLGYKFDKKDIIFTKNGVAQLTFKDNTVITLGENSKLIIEQYFLDNKNIKKSKAKFRFAKGLFKTITGAIGHAKHSNFKVFTKTATIGIRGTIFRVKTVLPTPNLKMPQTTAAVDQGSIVVTSNTGASTIVNRGEAIGVDLSGMIKPVPFNQLEDISVNRKSKKNKKGNKKNSQKNSKTGSKTEKKTKRKTSNAKSSNNKKDNGTKTSERQNKNNSSNISSSTKNQNSTNENGNIAPNRGNVEHINKTASSLGTTLNQTDQTINETTARAEENQRNKQTEEAVEEENGGNQPNINLPPSANNIDNILPPSIPNRAQKTLYEDSYVTFGYWEKSDMTPDTMWIVGKNLTDPDTIIDNYIINHATASYSGVVKGIENGKLGDGDINLNIDFGSQTINGDMDFQAPGESRWSMSIDGNAYANGFDATISDKADSEVKNITGTLSGNYFGGNAEAIGGSFSATGSNKKVDGVFEGVKQ